jgi:alanyl aminopeptidase
VSASPAPKSAPPLAAVVSPGADEPVPALLLPRDTRPLAEAIELTLDPRQERYSGAVDIDVQLERARSVVWLHGQELHVTRASVTPAGGAPIPATWQVRHASGVAGLALSSSAPAGRAKIRVEFDAAFGTGQRGLYRTTEAGVPYAFTQFEAIAARDAFPCFDEPDFKIPFTTTLIVPADQQAIANAQEVGRTPAGPSVRVTFAPTAPLPSYLVAFAVGPLDVVAAPDVPPNAVRARPLPLRGVAARGRGNEMAYALKHTGEILATLEKYFGIAYPWDKLDILAVPGKGGAMENPGAVTFGERLLLMDEAAPVGQRRGYAGVMAHELAHQWTGDLVTMRWWDDTWLNEAFATWVGNKATEAWDPKTHAQMAFARSIQGAMGSDSLVSARAIRQPIESTHDIENAFDSITYQKGGGVLAMFEQWAGADAWQRGLHAYLEKHSHGNATADDFLDAENEATGKDVKSAFHTFLDQVGVPLIELSVDCGSKTTVHYKQSRYLPAGSTGDASVAWKIPMCMRTGGTSPALPAGGQNTNVGETCALLTQPQGDVELASCPGWIFPNADAAGYYRFLLSQKDLANLRARGLGKLTAREKLAYATSIRAAFSRATMPMKDVLDAVAPLAQASDPILAEEPMGYAAQARDWLFGGPSQARVEAYARGLYTPAARRLGWDVAKDGTSPATPERGRNLAEDDETRTLRASVLSFLATTAQDPAVRAEAKKRGRAYLGLGGDGAIHAEAVDPNLAGIAVAVVGEDADRATWSAMRAAFEKSVDETVRSRLLHALSVAKNPELSKAGRDLTLDPALRDNEIIGPIATQLSRPETRDAAWAWLKENVDAVLARMPRHHGGSGLVHWAVGAFCDEGHAREAEALFAPKVDAIDGGPRTLAASLEDVRLCVARRNAHEASARAFFR